MKKILIVFLCICALISLAACKKDDKESEASSNAQSEIENKYNLAENIQDGVILHAWNWSYKTIEENLEEIADAGFSAVQTSPVQQPKSYNALATSVKQSWWKLYQPISFSIGNAWLGAKADLTSLCAKAKEFGIKIIVDIVANHMANDQSYEGYSSQIEQYEPTIYKNCETFFRPYKDSTGTNISTGDGNAYYVTQGSLGGLPDLDTSNEYIQERVISLLKECVDCGVSGFRFDAAKHIETPDDGEYASDFWPNVINTTKDYAQETYKRDIYCYGEILNTPGNGRKDTSYTPYMSITDNATSNNITLGCANRKIGGVYSGAKNFMRKVNADKIVLWVESHDTYMNNSTTYLSTKVINKAWSVVANRNGATALYFARPGDAGMGECGNYNWMSQEVSVINKFHNFFTGVEGIVTRFESEDDENFLINERVSNDKTGVIITRIEPNYDLETNIVENIPVANMPDGKYIDHISGNEFVIENGLATGECSDSDIIVLYDQEPQEIRAKIPEISYYSETNYFYQGGSTEVIISVENSDNVYYQIDGGEKKALPQNKTISVDKECNITITAEGYVNIIKNIEIGIPEKREGYWCIGGVAGNISENQQVYAWVWANGADGTWREVEFVDNYYYIEQRQGDYGMLLAYFNAGTKITDASWDLAPAQTQDMGVPLNDNVVYTAK